MTIANLLKAQKTGLTMTLNGCIVRINNGSKRYTVESKTGEKLIATNKELTVIKTTKC